MGIQLEAIGARLIWEWYGVQVQKLYPGVGNPIQFTSGAAFWGWGAWTQIIPINTITVDFLIIAAYLEVWSALNDRSFYISFAKGAPGSETEILDVTGAWTNPLMQNPPGSMNSYHYVVPFPLKVAANARIAVRVADGLGGLNYKCRIGYVEAA